MSVCIATGLVSIPYRRFRRRDASVHRTSSSGWQRPVRTFVRLAGSSRSPRVTASAKSRRSASVACSRKLSTAQRPSVSQRKRASGGRSFVFWKSASASRKFAHCLRSTSGCGSE